MQTFPSEDGKRLGINERPNVSTFWHSDIKSHLTIRKHKREQKKKSDHYITVPVFCWEENCWRLFNQLQPRLNAKLCDSGNWDSVSNVLSLWEDLSNILYTTTVKIQCGERKTKENDSTVESGHRRRVDRDVQLCDTPSRSEEKTTWRWKENKRKRREPMR